MGNEDFKANGLTGSIQIEDQDFLRLSSFIMSHYGIKLLDNKKTLIQCRLQKRLKQLDFNSFTDYTNYVFTAEGMQNEVPQMIDAVSTNKTDFFREPAHFEFLKNIGISDYLRQTKKNSISIWSAGCSTGEEPYSIAMLMKEYTTNQQIVDFSILATDIAQSVLEHAVAGVFADEKTGNIPPEFKKKYLLKGKNAFKNKVRMNSEIRSKIAFRTFNLLNPVYYELGSFDIIFCRNVLIYFQREVQHRLLKQFTSVLNPAGFLFLGHSESITGYSLPLKTIRPTIFQKTTN